MQHRHLFEFNEQFLNLLAHHSTSCRFVEFMLDSELERLRAGAPFFSDIDDDGGGTLVAGIEECSPDQVISNSIRVSTLVRTSSANRPSVSQSVSAPPNVKLGATSSPNTPRHAAPIADGSKKLSVAHSASGGQQTVNTLTTSTPDGRPPFLSPVPETVSLSSASADASATAIAAYPIFHSLYSYFKYYSNQTPRFHNPYYIDKMGNKVCIHSNFIFST